MGFFKGIGVGIGAYGRAFSLLFSRQLWWFMLFPVAVTILLFALGGLFVEEWGDNLASGLETRVTGWTMERAWLGWAGTVAGVLARWLLRVIYYFSFLFWGGYLVMAVMSPVYSWLSERVEARLSGRRYPFRWRRFLWEAGRGALLAFGSMLLQTLVLILLFVCSFIPLAGLLTPLAGFLASSYFYGFAFMDYAVERKRFTVSEGIGFIHRHVGVAVGVGGVFVLSLLLPLWSLFTCSFMSLLAVIAASVAIEQQH
ncbi:MAG: EI24 domain-containing protein [Odoribacteraceae bacterium]|jgi:CysZ protein|nr:EI24 domain-containing protein [Odoribacteraceae bacterium]